MTHPLHQHGLIPVASGLLGLAALALVLVHHHGVDRVAVWVPVTESSRVVGPQRYHSLSQSELVAGEGLPVGGALLLLGPLATLALLAALAALGRRRVVVGLDGRPGLLLGSLLGKEAVVLYTQRPSCQGGVRASPRLDFISKEAAASDGTTATHKTR